MRRGFGLARQLAILLLAPVAILSGCRSGTGGDLVSAETPVVDRGRPLPHLDRVHRWPADEREPAATAQPYVIGAWYFTAWSRTNPFHAGQSKEALNRYDPWGSVRDNFLAPSYSGYTPRKPLIGFYDALDQRVMDTHILQAASRGLSYFAFYWYWDTDREEEALIATPVHRFATSRYKSLMKFMIAPLRFGHRTTSWTAWTKRLVPYIVHTYFADPSYLTTPDGRPIITDWDLGLSATDHARALRFLRSYSLAHLGKSPLVLYLSELSLGHGSPTPALALGVDGFQCFQGITVDHAGQPYRQMMASWPIDGLVRDYFHVPCTTVGFDARAWCQVFPACEPGGSYHHYAVDNTPYEFAVHLRTVRAYLDENAASTGKMLTIYAWNEWGEGAYIEPDVEHGFGYLDAIRDVFGLHPTVALPPAVDLEADYPAPGEAVKPFEATVQKAYGRLLERQATSDEVEAWSSQYDRASLSKMDFLIAIYRSEEFQARQPTSSSEFIDLLYRRLLGRHATEEELAYWVPRATSARERLKIFVSLLYSTELEERDPTLYATQGAPSAMTWEADW